MQLWIHAPKGSRKLDNDLIPDLLDAKFLSAANVVFVDDDHDLHIYTAGTAYQLIAETEADRKQIEAIYNEHLIEDEE